MPFRQLPNSDPTRTAALDAAHTRWLGAPAAERLITAAHFAQLDETDANCLRKTWLRELGEAAIAEGGRIALTGELDVAFLAAGQMIRHYFQVFDFAVERGEILAAHRAFYERPVETAHIPPITKHSDVGLWAARITAGEIAREEAATTEHPYIEMAMPSAGEVAAKAAAFAALLPTQDEAQNLAADELRDVADLREAVDALIRSMWNTIEFNLGEQGLSASAIRAEARLWGVVYIPRPGEEEDPEPEPPTP